MPELSNRERIDQIARWLWCKFRAPYPVEVRLCKKIGVQGKAGPRERQRGDDGECYRVGRLIVIRLSTGCGRVCTDLIHNLVHEWAHAHSMRHDAIEHKRAEHDPEWGLAHQKVYHAFFDEGGWRESRGF